MRKFKFAEYGRIYINIYIKPLSGATLLPVKFKVDTGADRTTVSRDTLEYLGYDREQIIKNAVILKEEERPVTASGEKINAGYVQLPLLNILGYEGKNWPFEIILDEDRDFRNLLGRDLLAGFNYQFNNDERIFSIERTKVYNPQYNFLPGQEINELHII
jgi:hypothetical protein